MKLGLLIVYCFIVFLVFELCISMCKYVYKFVCMCEYASVCVCVNIYVFECVYVCIFMCVYIYVYGYVWFSCCNLWF